MYSFYVRTKTNLETIDREKDRKQNYPTKSLKTSGNKIRRKSERERELDKEREGETKNEKKKERERIRQNELENK